MSDYFYITTAIDYPNGSPHMGHAYEKIVSDAYARWYRLHDRKVYFLTGTDENGQKLARAASDAGMDCLRFIDEQVKQFKTLCEVLNISIDDFIRTTESRHIDATHKLWKTLADKGDIYFDRYSGDYCLGCESFYTKTQAPDQLCPTHGTKLEFIEEEGFFFRLSKYADWIQNHLESSKTFVVPESARSEMLGRLKADPLQDLSISRPNAGWGIPVQGNQEHVIYTWFDALINYYSAVTEGAKSHPEIWPADVHVIGKDITWFHTVIWPIMLHAAGIQLPHQVLVHGMVLAEDGRRMSKSLGNGVDPIEMANKYGVDSFRYYLLRAIAIGHDGAFSEADLKTRHNNELANVYGNTLQRVAKFAAKKFNGKLEPSSKIELDMRDIYKRMADFMDKREHHRALDSLWDGLNQVNAYLNANEPWRIKDNDLRVHEIVYSALHALHSISVLATPFLPETGKKALEILGLKDGPRLKECFDPMTFQLGELNPLFPRID